jgi:hypothetical protein
MRKPGRQEKRSTVKRSEIWSKISAQAAGVVRSVKASCSEGIDLLSCLPGFLIQCLPNELGRSAVTDPGY